MRAVLGLATEQVGVVADGQHDDVGVERGGHRTGRPGPHRAQREPLGCRCRGARRPPGRRRRAARRPTGRSPRAATTPSRRRAGARGSSPAPPSRARWAASARRIQPPPVHSSPVPAARSVKPSSPQSMTSWCRRGPGGRGEGGRRSRRRVARPWCGTAGDRVRAGHHGGGREGVRDRDRVRRGAGVPVVERWSASGPITAIRGGRSSGRMPSFSRRTTARVGRLPREGGARGQSRASAVVDAYGSGRGRTRRAQPELELARRGAVDVGLVDQPALQRLVRRSRVRDGSSSWSVKLSTPA